MIKLTDSRGVPIPVKLFSMPDGAPHCDYTELLNRSKLDSLELKITASIHSFDEFGHLCLLLKGINHLALSCNLEFAYLPMRQDKHQIGIFPTCKFYAETLKNCIGSNVTVTFFCPHSDDAVSEFSKVGIPTKTTFYNYEISKFLDIRNYTDIIFPDAGAKQRFEKLDFFKFSFLRSFSKKRDPHSGHITLSNPLHYIFENHKNVLVFDDLCDGGATFIEVAKLIKANSLDITLSYEKPHLFVYHGIFSKGYKELAEYYSRIYTTNSFRLKANFCQEVERKSEIVKMLNLYDWN